MAKRSRRLGSELEEAVYLFAKTLDPSSEVLFNHTVPDRDTGAPRQCDVWINAKFGGHWPLVILVSCKDHKRKLHSGDIGTFRDEIRSTGASTGVIYSRAGFTQPAVHKAIASGLTCCRLYQKASPDIPRSIWFEHFACSSQIRLTLKTDPRTLQVTTWNELFALTQDSRTLLDIIAATFARNEEEAVHAVQNTGAFPPDWQTDLSCTTDGFEQPITIQISGRWKRYRAQVEATLLNGSYCVNDGSFKGTQAGPFIDTQSEHPGEVWTEITEQETALPANRVIEILFRGNTQEALREKMGPQALYP